MKRKCKIWGFRSNKKWLKKISLCYYILSMILLITAMLSTPHISVSEQDMFLYRLSNILFALGFLLPPLFLSNFKWTDKVPFLKKRKRWKECFIFVLIFLGMASLSQIVDSTHSYAYQNAYQEYKILEKTAEPSTQNEKELLENFNQLSEEKMPSYNKEMSGILKIHYLDVGQGDSIFIELPNQETMLIDAAEYNQRNTIINTIQELGYTKIDYLIATHPHADHIGGMASIVDTFEIGNIYMPKVVTTSKTYENLLKSIQEKNKKIKIAKNGVKIMNTDDLQIAFIAPNQEKYNDLNNYSAVLKITYQDRKFLFMGDAEAESEQEITEDVHADAIKIGHHGSDTSSSIEFVNKVKPKYAIISVGTDNSYHHPVLEIVNRWKNIGAEIYQTNIDGTITIETDGKNLSVHSNRNEEITPTISSEENQVSKELQTPKENQVSKNNQSIQITEFTETAHKGETAKVSIQGLPNTRYQIHVTYESESQAKGLEEKVSDENGKVSWTWKIGTNTKTKEATITITGGENTITQKMKIE